MCSVVDLEWEDIKQINSESKVEGMNTYDMIQERTNATWMIFVLWKKYFWDIITFSTLKKIHIWYKLWLGS
jgi:hypothetical protein